MSLFRQQALGEHVFAGFMVNLIEQRTGLKVNPPRRSGEVHRQFTVSKGAPQAILKLAADVPQIQAVVEKIIGESAARGFRSVGDKRTDDKG